MKLILHLRDTTPGCHHWQRQIAAFWQSYLETSQLLCQRPFENADEFLRKYPNQWSDKNFELAKRVARMAKQNVQALRRDASIQCQNYFEQRSIESRYEEPSSTDMESPSNSILDFADNAILARHDQEAPAQECYHNLLFISFRLIVSFYSNSSFRQGALLNSIIIIIRNLDNTFSLKISFTFNVIFFTFGHSYTRSHLTSNNFFVLFWRHNSKLRPKNPPCLFSQNECEV